MTPYIARARSMYQSSNARSCLLFLVTNQKAGGGQGLAGSSWGATPREEHPHSIINLQLRNQGILVVFLKLALYHALAGPISQAPTHITEIRTSFLVPYWLAYLFMNINQLWQSLPVPWSIIDFVYVKPLINKQTSITWVWNNKVSAFYSIFFHISTVSLIFLNATTHSIFFFILVSKNAAKCIFVYIFFIIFFFQRISEI